MAKDGSKPCRDCDMAIPFLSVGNGKCKYCKGEGRVVSIVDALFGEVRICEECCGTGQCQTCGGTRLEYYYNEKHIYDEEESESSCKEDYEWVYDSKPIPTGKDDSNWIVESVVGFFVIGIAVLLLLNMFGIDTRGTNSSSGNINRDERPQGQDIKTLTDECETNNSGTIHFRNNTSKTIYVFLGGSGWSETIEVKPRDEYSKDLAASDEEYNYTYHYYATPHKDSPIGFKIQSCKTKTITLNLPEAKYYSILFNVWTEITFPEAGVYRIFVADGEFYYKYENDDKINSGFTHYIQRVQKGDKIYFATSNPQGEELGIAKEARQSSSEEIAEVPKPQEDTKPKESKPTGHVYEHYIEDISVVEPSMVTKLAGTIGELQVACDLTINPDKTVECDCNPGTYFDPTVYFRGSVAKNGTLRLGHYVNGGVSDYVTLKLRDGCYVGKSIGVNGLYFIRLCPQ